ncbi:MAG: ribonucleoside-diphosphate reductase subunit alpha [Candidatus Falkowbacteria bacterium]|nr:ribonucleoside-diphosphate reductase subunit alpha [Candidatus Falkowbacteria bacterium]
MKNNLKTSKGTLIDDNFLRSRLSAALAGVDKKEDILDKLIQESSLAFYDSMPEEELDKAIINTAAQNIKDEPIYDRVAARLSLFSLYRDFFGSDFAPDNLANLYRQSFAKQIERSVTEEALNEKMLSFDLEVLSKAIDPEADFNFSYTGISTLIRRYLRRDQNQQIAELPQHAWMRIAMGLSWNEEDKNIMAEKFYQKMSALDYLPGGSTNINAGAKEPRLSNCFLMEMEDNVSHIGKTVADVLKLSKATGGIGLAVTKLRASGSPISTNNTFSSGPVPFLHIIDSAIRAISRAGKKMGALCFFMENWHYDFAEFLDLKQNAGDDYRRTRTANIAAYLSDEFMRRVKADEFWYLFDPKETADLIDLYGEDFSRRYLEYCDLAEQGKMRIFKKMKARDQFRSIVVFLQATSHPWITFKDTINVRALNNNTGTIYGSNLCTEITLPTDENNIAVCNIMSINLAKHLKEGKVDYEKLKDSVRLSIRQLDNLVDINRPPVVEAKNFDDANRAIGLGVMGLADVFETLNLAYNSQAAFDLTDEVMEFISYQAIDASCELAASRGVYQNFPGSRWSQGLVPFDTVQILATARQEAVDVNQKTHLDWDSLRAKVKQGMRNSTLLAIAPTANIGLVAGTSTGIDPRFAQIFSRNTLGGKYLELNINLVKKLQELNLWERTKGDLLASYGDLSELNYLPEDIKNIYKDSFSVGPEAFLEVAARAQKWVDQAISRNMYLATRDPEEVMAIYISAWERGLKTTYYLHMKPRHSAEQSTVKVNKASSIGKRGFGATLSVPLNEVALPGQACPLDPQERLNCESCQ